MLGIAAFENIFRWFLGCGIFEKLENLKSWKTRWVDKATKDYAKSAEL